MAALSRSKTLVFEDAPVSDIRRRVVNAALPPRVSQRQLITPANWTRVSLSRDVMRCTRHGRNLRLAAFQVRSRTETFTACCPFNLASRESFLRVVALLLAFFILSSFRDRSFPTELRCINFTDRVSINRKIPPT